jgi:hypothetical protein
MTMAEKVSHAAAPIAAGDIPDCTTAVAAADDGAAKLWPTRLSRSSAARSRPGSR